MDLTSDLGLRDNSPEPTAYCENFRHLHKYSLHEATPFPKQTWFSRADNLTTEHSGSNGTSEPGLHAPLSDKIYDLGENSVTTPIEPIHAHAEGRVDPSGLNRCSGHHAAHRTPSPRCFSSSPSPAKLKLRRGRGEHSPRHRSIWPYPTDCLGRSHARDCSASPSTKLSKSPQRSPSLDIADEVAVSNTQPQGGYPPHRNGEVSDGLADDPLSVHIYSIKQYQRYLDASGQGQPAASISMDGQILQGKEAEIGWVEAQLKIREQHVQNREDALRLKEGTLYEREKHLGQWDSKIGAWADQIAIQETTLQTNEAQLKVKEACQQQERSRLEERRSELVAREKKLYEEEARVQGLLEELRRQQETFSQEQKTAKKEHRRTQSDKRRNGGARYFYEFKPFGLGSFSPDWGQEWDTANEWFREAFEEERSQTRYFEQFYASQHGHSEYSKGSFGSGGHGCESRNAKPTTAGCAHRPGQTPSGHSSQAGVEEFQKYTACWKSLPRFDPNVRYPTPDGRADGLSTRNQRDLPPASIEVPSEDKIKRYNVWAFFLRGHGLVPRYEAGPLGSRNAKLSLGAIDREKLEKLAKTVKAERTKWHPDSLGFRNRQNPGTNARLQGDPSARAIFNALSELLDVLDAELKPAKQ